MSSKISRIAARTVAVGSISVMLASGAGMAAASTTHTATGQSISMSAQDRSISASAQDRSRRRCVYHGRYYTVRRVGRRMVRVWHSGYYRCSR